MEFKGTKGKWNTFNERVEKRGQFTDLVICRFEPRMSTTDMYNALLISKAPEMLEMLEDIKDYLGSDKRQEVEQLIKSATEL